MAETIPLVALVRQTGLMVHPLESMISIRLFEESLLETEKLLIVAADVVGGLDTPLT